MSAQEIETLSQSQIDLNLHVKHCSVCFNLSEVDPCAICISEKRDRRIICVVEEANDVLAFERIGEYRGLYHVLGGVLSPLDGIGPDDLNVKPLLARLNDNVDEVIVATNPSTEGEATALYLAKLIKPMGIRISRIARGIPVGADLEYADEMTLTRALEGRSTL